MSALPWARRGRTVSVDEYWIVDPDRRAVTVFRLEDGRYAAGERVRAGRIPSRVLPALEIAIDEIFTD